MASFREKRALEKKNNIIKAAAEVFKEKGYYEATVEEIAHRLEYTKGSIYYYVNSKEDLLFYCHEMAMDIFLANAKNVVETNDPPNIKLKNIIYRHVETLIDELTLVTVLLQHEYSLSPELHQKIVAKRDQYENAIRDIITDGMKQKIFKEGNHHMMRFIILGALALIPRWYRSSGSFSKKDIAEYYSTHLVEGIMAK